METKATPMLSTTHAHFVWKRRWFSTVRPQFDASCRQEIHTSFVFLNPLTTRARLYLAISPAVTVWSKWGKRVLKTLPHAISTRTDTAFDVNSSRLTTFSTFIHRSYPHKTQRLRRIFPIARGYRLI